MNIPQHIKEIMQQLVNNNYEAYIIGGAVRDYYMNIEPHDYDIFTNATGEQILSIFPNGKILGGEERQEKILTVIVDDVEVSQYRSNGDRTKTGTTLEEHQATCDFYINAMAVDINGKLARSTVGENIYNGMGLTNIQDRHLKFVGKESDRIKEDKLRILRGIRFMCKYGLIDNTTLMNNISYLHDLPKERVSEELKKILSIKKPWNNTYNLLFKVLRTLIPQLELVRGLQGGSHHNETVEEHLKYSLSEAFKITDNPLLKLAAFLHDVGKGLTVSQEAKGIIECPNCTEDNIRTNPICEYCGFDLCDYEFDEVDTHFYKHEKIGAEIIKYWMREFKFSEKEIKYVSTLVQLHMYSYKDEPSKKSYIKFFKKLEDSDIPIMDYIILIYSDHQGNKSHERIKFGDFVRDSWLLQKYWECKYTKEPFKVTDLVVGGKDLIERYNMTPGPLIGKILNEVLDKIIDGDLRNERAEIFHLLDTIMKYEAELND